MGGLDKLNVQPSAVIKDGSPDGAPDGEPRAAHATTPTTASSSTTSAVDGVVAPEERAGARALAVRRPGARHPRHRRRLPRDRRLRDRGGPRLHARRTSTSAAPVAILGTEAVASSSPTATPSARRCASATRRSRSSACCASASSASASPTATSSAGATGSSRSRRRSWRGASRATSTTAWTASSSASRPRRDGDLLEGPLLAAEGEPPPAGGLPPRRRRRPRAQGAEPGGRLRHHLHAVRVPVADRRRHRQRQHPDGDAEGAHPRGRRQDGDRRVRPRGLQGVHDRGAAADARRLARRARHRRRLLEDHHGLDRRAAAHRPEELRVGVPARRPSSASSSRSTRR